MKNLTLRMLFCFWALLFVADIFAQVATPESDPYQNLGQWKIYNNGWQYPGTVPPEYEWDNEDDWYGTQAMPESYEKAEWGLQDINAHRKLIGLKPLDEKIIERPEPDTSSLIISMISILIFAIVAIIYIYKLIQYRKERKELDKKIESNIKDIAFEYYKFAEIWRSMEEFRRRNNVGNFVDTFEREPTEEEIVTGIVKEF
jgi:hypothetical protein